MMLPLLLLAMEVTAASASAPDAGLRADLYELARHRVAFGHQSVGAGLVAAVRRLAIASGIPLRVAEIGEGSPLPAETLGHFLVQRNGDPRRKLAEFEGFLSRMPDGPPDMALVKFCFVDVGLDTDPDALFEAYRTTLVRLEKRFPDTVFVHVTIPLTTVQRGFKARLKGFLGHPPHGFLENARREQFNSRLRAAFGGPRLFDLAMLESTLPGGTVRHIASWREHTVPALPPESALDDAHLAPGAEDRIARELVATLATLARLRPRPLESAAGRPATSHPRSALR
jgi:hypothetical protein